MSLMAGLLARPLTRSNNEDERLAEMDALSSGLGNGITLAALGGYRNVAANFVWISMYGDWQYRRKVEVLEKMKLAVSLNPDSLYFWIDGSRIIANDMPVWEVGDDRMNTLFDESRSEGIEVRKRYGKEALSFLEEAPVELSKRYEVLLEKAAICWKRLGDIDRALRFLSEAVEIPRVPYYVCRVYAELLHRNGETGKALRYLESHYETLPENDSRAMKPFVARRIEELRRELTAGQ